MFLLGRRPDPLQPSEEEIRRLHETLPLATSEAKDSSRALVAVLRKLCMAFGWDYAEAWVPSRDGSVLKPGPAWPRTTAAYQKYRLSSRKLGFLPGGGLPGRVWRDRWPVWLEDIAQVPAREFTRGKLALETGFRSAVAAPILSGNDVVAVVVYYRGEVTPKDAAALEALTRTLAPLGPVVARKQIEVELAIREGQQKAVAQLGLRALAEPLRLDEIMKDGVKLAANTLGVGYCKLLELEPDGRFKVRAGVGWKKKHDIIEGSQAGYTLLNHEAIIVQDLDREKRFTPSQLLKEHGIVSGLSVIIHGRETPYGVLSAHAQQRRTFTPDDMHFLQAVANVIGAALERSRAENELDGHRRHLEDLVEQRSAQLEQSHERLRIAERLASIGTLAAGLGHDLGNTILPILCRLDSLEAGTLSDPAREDLAAVRQAVEYLRQLSQGLRLFALDPDTGGLGGTELADWWVRVSPLLRNALPKRIQLRGTFPDYLPPVAVAPHRLSQAVLNLVANSAEAIAGDGGVYVWAEMATDGGGFVRLGVADNGRGMSTEVRRHSLDPFFTTKKRGLSTGLGLALVHAVAKSCGGTVEIESTKGTGTTILLSLPVAELTSDAPDLGPRKMVAAVSLSDARTGGYAELLLRSIGIEVERTEGDPGDTQVWITEPTETSLALARQYVNEDTSRRVVFYGEDPGTTRHTGFVFVDRRSGPDAMRRSLRQVVFQLLEHDNDE